MTIGSVLFTLAIVGGIYSAYRWANRITKDTFEARNPDFEFLRRAGGSNLKVRHRPTGREFTVIGPGLVRIRRLTTADADPPPEWTKLPNARRGPRGEWELNTGVAPVRDELGATFGEHGYRLEGGEDFSVMTGCNPKTLACVTYASGGTETTAWYSVRASAVK